MNFAEEVTLEKLRGILIRLEDTILFSFIERAQFGHNRIIYEKNSKQFEGLGFNGSFMEYLLFEMEKCHARVRRYTSPDEYPFSDRTQLPSPMLKPYEFPEYLHEKEPRKDVNKELMHVYVDKLIPRLCVLNSNDGNYGSSATRDVECLQALSKRIHYGKFIAESKYRDPETHDKYIELIKSRDTEGLMRLLTNKSVEEALLKRLERKAYIYGQDITLNEAKKEDLRISAQLVVDLYRDYVIPLTKKVEVDYLLQREEDL